MNSVDFTPSFREHKMKFWLKILRTCLVLASWVCMGMFSEITGPTLPALKVRVNSNYEEISRILVTRSVGFLVGAIMGGVLIARYPKRIDAAMSFALFLAAVGTVFAPHCRSLALLALMCSLDGLGKGILASVGNAYILRVWGEKSSVPCHALHCAFGIGALMSPQIARPFLPTSYNVTTTQKDDPTHKYKTSHNSTILPPIGGYIEHAYLIIALFTFALCVVFLFLNFSYKPKQEDVPKTQTLREMFNPLSTIEGDNVFALKMLGLLFIFFMLPVGAERAYGKFLFPFAIESKIKMDKDMGTYLETTFWACFTTGRGVATVFARWIRPSFILGVEVLCSLVCAAMLVAYADDQPLVLWIFSGFFAATLAPTFPASIIWANFYVDMEGMAVAMSFIASSIGAFLFSWMAGYFFEYHGPNALMYIILAYAICAVIILALLFGLTFKRETRFEEAEEVPDLDRKADRNVQVLSNGKVIDKDEMKSLKSDEV